MAKLLLITPDELLAKAYGARLLREGFEVEHDATGHQGLARSRRWIPDLILLDLILPGMHGLDVLKWFRDVPWLVQVHVVLLIEGTLEHDVLNECLLWGAESYLLKDACSLHEMVAHVHRTLQSTVAPPPPPLIP